MEGIQNGLTAFSALGHAKSQILQVLVKKTTSKICDFAICKAWKTALPFLHAICIYVMYHKNSYSLKLNKSY